MSDQGMNVPGAPAAGGRGRGQGSSGAAGGAGAWPPSSNDLATVLADTTRIWHEPFNVLSLRTGGHATGSTSTGYNAASSRGIWSPNGENYMNNALAYPGANSWSKSLNHLHDWQAIDPTFPPLALYDITAEGLELRATGNYPDIRASLAPISGNTSYLGAILTTASAAKFARPYVLQVVFTLKTMGAEEFPAIWTLGEHYALDINDPTFKHYEIDLFERFGADFASDLFSVHTHINGVSNGNNYDINTPIGPDVETTVTVLHTETELKVWRNGVHLATLAHPVGQQYPNDRDHILLNQLIGMSWRAYPATHADGVMVVRSVEVFKPEAVALDLIPPIPPVPVLSGFAGTLSNGANLGTVVGTLSGATSYRVIGYTGLEVSGSNLVVAEALTAGDHSFYIEGLAADGTPGIPPAYALTVTADAPALTSPSIIPTERTTADLAVTTDTGSGTLYWIIDADGTTASVAEVKAGQKAGGSAATDSGSVAVSGTGVQSIGSQITGLTSGTAYVAQFVHEGSADSAVTKSAAVETFCDDAFNYYNLFSTPATRDTKQVINDFIRGLQIDGNWTALDAIQIYAMKPDISNTTMVSQVSLIDMRTPARSATLTSAPALTSGLGFVTDGVDDIINTQFAPNAGPNFVRDSNYFGYWNTQNVLVGVELSNEGAGTNQIDLTPRNGNNALTWRANMSTAAASANGSVTTSLGYTSINRNGSTATQAFKNGAFIAQSTQASGALAANTLRFGRAFGTTFRISSCAAILAGGARTGAQHQQIYDRLRTLMTALGVA